MTEPGRFDTVRTDRLLMRRWLDSDRGPFAALNADPETMVFFPRTLDRQASDRLVDLIEERFDQQGFGLWALEVAGTGEFIGFTGLNPMPDEVPGAGGVESAGGLTGMPGITATPRRRPQPLSGWPSTAWAWRRSGR
jgi:RimJ/RimL family protein N-acetyltransferase